MLSVKDEDATPSPSTKPWRGTSCTRHDRTPLQHLLEGLGVALLLAFAAPAQAMPSTIYVIRHLEKNPLQGDGPLTGKGRAHAQCVAPWFAGKHVAKVYHSELKRSAETAQIIAGAAHAPLAGYMFADEAGLVATIRAETAPVVIVSHSDKIPQLVAALTGGPPADVHGYGEAWIVAGGKSAHADLFRERNCR